MNVLLTGATGYVGSKLLQALAASGQRVRCMARNPATLRPKAGPNVEVVAGDVFDPESLRRALHGMEAAYYLVHSMGTGHAFEEEDRLGARNFSEAARLEGVRRIVYLGGLADPKSDLSPHLRSRLEVGEFLRSAGVPVVEFRASIIIGSGSLSYEIIRALTERLPVMITPLWVRTLAQPVAIEDVVSYLLKALDLPEGQGGVFEIGGADRVSYGGIMKEYARQRGLRRVLIPVPVLTPRLSSLWLALVTPAHAKVGRALVEGVRNPTVVRNDSALRAFDIRPMGIRQAVERALRGEDSGEGRPARRLVDSRTIAVGVPPARAFAPIRRIGGQTGWYSNNWLWRLRGRIDSLVGGVGLRRGRTDPDSVCAGDTIDFWRVEAFEPDRRLRLFAEMKLPGKAWLEFEVEGGESGSIIRQTAVFDPDGLAGLLYWYALYPFHAVVFRGMLREIASRVDYNPNTEAGAATGRETHR